MNEADLIISLKNGDAKAFRLLVDTWQSMVFNTALGIVQDMQEAEDISQEVFVQVHQSIRGFRGDARLSTWLYRITVTKSLDAERKRKSRKRPGLLGLFFKDESSHEPVHFHHPGIQLQDKERAAILFNAVNSLPQNQRIAFLLVKTEGLSYEETAAVMQVTVKSLEALLHRAKENLRKKLKTYYQL